MFGRKKIAVLMAEFLGTGVLTLVVMSVQRSTIGIPYFIAIAAGLAVAAMSLLFSEVSGAHFNPAITIGMWTTRKVKTLAAVSYIVAQLLGGWAAYGVYTYFVNSSLQKIGGHYTARVMVAEAVGVFIFSFVWAAVAAKRLSASVVGIGLTLGAIVASGASMALLNPAVALGTRAWVIWGSLGWLTYVLGPVVGAVVGFNLYELVFTDGKFMRSRAASVSAAPAVAPPVTVTRATTTTARKSTKTAAKKKPVRKTKKA